jgi:2-succinyl-6-hydroxy-2,4-cyclohexadiene-1-carboxylate synthase
MPGKRVNDIYMHYRLFGSGPRLLMLHGFTGSIEAWQGIPERLGDRYRVIAVDLIGHGETAAPVDPARYSIEHAVTDLLALLDQLEVKQTALLGYSMGGRVAQHLALDSPERFPVVVLENTAPGIDDPEERATRQASDERQAQMIEKRGLERFIRHWESIPLFESQKSLPDDVRTRQREIRLRQNPTGLANSLRGMGAGSMEPVTSRLDTFSMPVLYLAGEYDTKYRKLGKQMTGKMPCAEYVEIAGAGHTIHLEQPDAYIEKVTEFLDKFIERE